jgi:ribosome biogenesis GTPase
MSSIDVAPALGALGFTPAFHNCLLSLELSPLAVPARVVAEHRSEYRLAGAHGYRRAVLSGKLRHALHPAARPCVGDWVVCADGMSEPARIEHVLERTTSFARRAVGRTSEVQPIAANVDIVGVVCALSPVGADRHAELHALNPRRLERYLHAARGAGCRTLVIVNKADLHPHPDAVVGEIRAVLGSVDTLAVSAASGTGIAELAAHVAGGETLVLVGSSGVGKSSLTNQLLGDAQQRTAAVRDADSKGRHTTTERELFVLPTGGVLIDTPGMREFGLAADDPDEGPGGFEDIDALSRECRFADCGHAGEPGCAVRVAIEEGRLSEERARSAAKLAREAEWQRERASALARQQRRAIEKKRTRALHERLESKGIR